MSFDGVNAYPLSWPVGWERTAAFKRRRSQFASRSLASARAFVLDELRLMKAQGLVISTNVELRRDGLPRSGRRQPEDPGVAVYFNLNAQPKVLACDRWHTVEENLWAIGKHIEALRGQQRWGVGTLEQAFRGYDALPSPKVTWWEVLEVDPQATPEEVLRAYRRKARACHPDAGGSADAFLGIQAAWDAYQEGGQG